jgi:O-antigen/teichoic acid export membrane protein
VTLAGWVERIRAGQGSVAMGSAITVAFNGLSLLAYGMGSVLVNRKIGPEQTGQLAWFVTTTQVTAIFADLLGVYYANLQLTASRSHDFPEPEVRTTVLVYAAFLGLAVTSLLMLTPPLREAALPGYGGTRWTVLAIAGVVGTMLVNQIRGLFWSQSRFIWVGLLWFLRTSSYAAIGITGVHLLSWSTSGELALAHVAASWVCVAVATVFLAASGLGRFRLSFLAASWRTGMRGYFQNMLSLVHQRADQYVISRYLGWNDLGLYTVVANLAEVLAQIPGSIGMVVFTDSARKGNHREASRVLVRRAGYVMLGIAVLGGLLYWSGTHVIGLLFGTAFVAAAGILGTYVPALVVQSGVLVVNSHVSASGYPAYQLAAIACAALANLVLGLALAPRFGTSGVAAALGLSYLLWLVLIGLRIYRSAYGAEPGGVHV